jgi:hypothetical protein
MRRFLFIGIAMCVGLATPPAAAAGLGEAGDLQAARSNARAGGPVSERDAELLQRYGCESGTKSPACPGYGNRGYAHRYYR